MLLSFGLVLIATVLLVLGLLVGDGLTLIYLSIALSSAAAIILFVAVRVSKPNLAPATAPAPLVPDDEPEYATVGAPAAAASVATEPAPAPTATLAQVPAEPAPPDVAADSGEWLAADQAWEEPSADWEDDEDDEELDFPIADYDELTEEEILPLLPQLYSDELDVVEARERQGQSRLSILAALSQLRAAADPDADVPVGELLHEPTPPSTPISVAEPVADEWTDTDGVFPIEDYDSLSLGEVYPLLDELDDEELEIVREHEAANRNRQTLISHIDRRLGREVVEARTRVVAARRPSGGAAPRLTAKRAPVPKKATAKKAAAPAKKATAKKAAAPAKKAAAKKAAPTKKAAAAKKATAKKAAAKRAAPGTRAPEGE